MSQPTPATVVTIEQHRAVICGAPVSAYTGWQHPFVTPLTLGRLAVHCRRAAYDEGWLDAQGGFFSLSRDSLQRRVVTIKKKNQAPDVEEGVTEPTTAPSPSQFSTVFVVAVEGIVNPAAVGVPIRNHVISRVEVFVSAIGNSSFGLGACLYAIGTDADRGSSSRADAKELYLGSVQLSYVHIDFNTRRPQPLPPTKRDGLTQSFSPEQADKVPKISRLNPASLYAEVVDKKSRPSKELFHQQVFALRPSDFDFNLHMNQSLYHVFALDALKGAIVKWLVQKLPKYRPNNAVQTTADSGDDVNHHTHDDEVPPLLERAVLSYLVGVLFGKDAVSGNTTTVEEASIALAEDPTTLSSLEQAVLQADSLVSAVRLDFVKEIRMLRSSDVSSDGDDESLLTLQSAAVVVTMIAPQHSTADSVTLAFCVCTAGSIINACGIITLGAHSS
ncbi:acyl-ACP thioesterase, putative [Bodo saltans]|uniref:Acyl-ACP thioesterase, putative n=1 Tax=Bodo saltans TaxID=75058 RepID=A0A0S4JK14_BODSA|nr:acyl-ACP thioesterase, putative [Bodo saltans]|eukprot:CUG90293.1 acyl-ACP thioesterase, putative [Bodo saltans]